jgi:NADH-quinone oxidoreductase subunit F
VLLLLEDSRQYGNVNYLLQHNADEVLAGAKLLMDDLAIAHCAVYLSEDYADYADFFASHGIAATLVDDPKPLADEVFIPRHLVHHGETLLELYRVATGQANAGNRLITLAGDVACAGVFEVPEAMTMAAMIATCGGGPKGEKPIRFVQVGGENGTVLGPQDLDRPYDTRALLGEASMLAGAKIEVHTEGTCIVQWSVEKMLGLSAQSCGKCVYCREGIFQLYRIVKDATEGKSRAIDPGVIRELRDSMRVGSQCDFGRSAANPLTTALALFADDYEKHMERKTCPSLQCLDYVNFYVKPDTCTGCGACRKVCPAGAIAGDDRLIHVIDMNACEKCGQCEEVCEAQAVGRYGSLKPKCPTEPVPVGSFATGAGGLGGRRRRRRKA